MRKIANSNPRATPGVEGSRQGSGRTMARGQWASRNISRCAAHHVTSASAVAAHYMYIPLTPMHEWIYNFGRRSEIHLSGQFRGGNNGALPKQWWSVLDKN